jgi:uncharacterized protein with PQ loop repeat
MTNYKIQIEDGVNKIYAFHLVSEIIDGGLIIKQGIKLYKSKQTGNIKVTATKELFMGVSSYVFNVTFEKQLEYETA